MIRIICTCAKLYEERLADKVLLVSFTTKFSETRHIEICFRRYHFLHLTGIKLDKKHSANQFYNMCYKGKIDKSIFEGKGDGSTVLKLTVLAQIMRLTNNAKMIGIFNNKSLVLSCDQVIGSITVCLGIRKINDCYIPITILKTDMRDITNDYNRIIAIFSKKIGNIKYNKLEYIAKGVRESIVNEYLKKD